jgi:stage III sporulation protein AE
MTVHRHRRAFAALLSLLLLALGLTLRVSAAADADGLTEELPEEYLEFLESIPEDLVDLLPDGLFSTDSGTVGDAVSKMSSFSYLLNTVLTLVGLHLEECGQILGTLCGLLLLSAICNALRSAFRRESVSRAFSFCATLVITGALLRQSVRCLERVDGYFSTLSDMSVAIIPLMGALYAMGGNVTAAVSASSGLSVFLTVLETLVGRSILPFCGVCMAFALVHSLDPSLRLGTLLSTLKKNYTTALSFLMMLLLAMLAAQTTLGARSDTLAMRSVRFAAGNLIPVVGGSVSELLRTVSAGVGYLRGVVGICGILLLLLTLLPTLLELFLLRLCWQLGASLADLLGCDREKKLLDEFASLLGFLIAAICICSSVLLLSLTLLTHCATALG